MENFNYRRFCLMFIFICSVFLIIGCSGGLETNHWIGEEGEPPTVINTINADGADGVALNTKIGATFSKEMAPATINTETFIVMQGTTVVEGEVDYTGVTAVFTPDSHLDPNTTYTATVTTGAKDLAGNALAADYVWSFTTGTDLDTTAPTVTNTVPGNGDSGVAINTKVSASFSEAMDPLTLTTNTFTLKDSSDVNVTGTLVYSGVTAVFTPNSDLDHDTTYTATVTTGAEDLAGNPLAADYVWSFTTGAAPDTTPPTVTHTVPGDGAEEVALNTKVSATFSEAMDPLTLTTNTFTLKNSITDTSVTGTVVYSGKTAVFTPNSNLASNTPYTATVTTGAKDLAGNAMTEDYVWEFTTGVEEDDTPPTVTDTVPGDGHSAVASTKVSASFSEAMDPLTLTTNTFTLKDNITDVNVTGTVSYSGVTAVFTPNSDLDYDTTYTATVTTGVKDLAGNAKANDYVWSFTTTSEALANPTAPALGETERFVMIASQAITTTSGSAIADGDLAILDQARSYYAGFTEGAEAGEFDELTNGISFAPDDTTPPYVIPEGYDSTVEFIDQVRTDLGIAYSFLAADPNPGAATQPCPIELGGETLTRGVYKTAENVIIEQGDLTLDAEGDPDSVWIFSIDGTLSTGAPGGNINLIGGAQAKNVYWRTAGVTTIGSDTFFKGNVFSWPEINVRTDADVTGRLFSVNEQVTLQSNDVRKAQ